MKLKFRPFTVHTFFTSPHFGLLVQILYLLVQDPSEIGHNDHHILLPG